MADQDAAYDHGTQAAINLSPRAGNDHERQHAEDSHEHNPNGPTPHTRIRTSLDKNIRGRILRHTPESSQGYKNHSYRKNPDEGKADQSDAHDDGTHEE